MSSANDGHDHCALCRNQLHLSAQLSKLAPVRQSIAMRVLIMKRRSFLQSSVAAIGTVAAVNASSARAAESSAAELFGLRTYTLKAARRLILDDFLGNAFLPALKRLGIGPVGVFVEKGTDDSLRVYLLTVFKTLDQVVTASIRLDGDDKYRKDAASYLAATATDPVYSRIESSLLRAISGLSRVQKPDSSKPRLFNLRIYESHNERASKKKIEMFNNGELAIFQRVGLTPVFFAETIVGAAMPNLTYMLVFPDDAGREAAWQRFRDDAEWKKLRAIPEYADKEIVSKITNKILMPAAYSEI
jgi:hypothetical protein